MIRENFPEFTDCRTSNRVRSSSLPKIFSFPCETFGLHTLQMSLLSILSIAALLTIGSARSFAGQPLNPQSMVIEYTDACVNIGPLRFVGGQTTMAEVESALGKPDRTATSNYAQYCYDSLGLKFLHPADSRTRTAQVLVYLNEKQTNDDVVAFGLLIPKNAFPGVIRLRGLEIKAPCMIKDLYPKLNPLFPRKEAVPGSDRFGNTVYRFGRCQTDFMVRKTTGEVTLITLDRPRPE